jgi:hypothetical protein
MKPIPRPIWTQLLALLAGGATGEICLRLRTHDGVVEDAMIEFAPRVLQSETRNATPSGAGRCLPASGLPGQAGALGPTDIAGGVA